MNLQAHRMRNKMTSLIYSMSLGFIIFLIVSYKLQINSTEIMELGRKGGYLTLSAKDTSLITPLTFDVPMKFNKQLIDSWGYVSYHMHKVPSAMIKETATSDKARIDYDDIDLYGVQPSVFDAAL